jgi:predicted transcriptional regulator
MRINICNNRKNDLELIPNDSYIRVYGFMRSKLGLEKTELLVYALIYSYFRNCESLSGSREYIAEWVGSGRTAVDRAISSLVEKGYITKEPRCYRGLHYIEYNVNVDALPPSSEHTNILSIWREDKKKNCNM